jgi:nitroreductase
MTTLDAIFSRRSIRKFKSILISKAIINKILKAAMQAPSAHNQQPWYFIVITDKDKLDQIPKFHKYAQMSIDAPAGILVCADVKKFTDEDFWQQDLSAATQNILLAIHALGLGGVWTGVYPKKEIMNGFKKLLELPNNIIPFSFIPFGEKAEFKEPNDRFSEDNILFS